jgi:prepilin-type N-terminal cleavage/methylation domain-containing protein
MKNIQPLFIPGFTLMELIVVLAIISVLVAMGVPLHNRTRERAIDTEAKAGLGLIQAGEEIYRARNGNFYPAGSSTSDISAINTNLNLNLNENLWDYAVSDNGADFTATATRNGGGFNRTYTIHRNDQPACGGQCP